MQFRKDNPEFVSTPVAEVTFSLAWQQLQRQQASAATTGLDLVDFEPTGESIEADCLEAECSVSELVLPDVDEPAWQPVVVSSAPVAPNFLDRATKRALGKLENSLQGLFSPSFAAAVQLDATQPCVAEATSLPTFCPKNGTWRLSA